MFSSRSILCSAALAISAAATVAAPAGADTFCVGPQPVGCDVAQPGTSAGLGQALLGAIAHQGEDTVLIAPGTYEVALEAVDADPLVIQGAGQGETFLHAAS